MKEKFDLAEAMRLLKGGKLADAASALGNPLDLARRLRSIQEKAAPDASRPAKESSDTKQFWKPPFDMSSFQGPSFQAPSFQGGQVFPGGMPAGFGRGAPGGEPADAEGSRFLSRSFTNHAGTRPYKVYIPASTAPRGAPLIVMLHGCTQSADDFAIGTRMNQAAEAHGCVVVYPDQVANANPQRCWNWFKSGDQVRGGGEASIIAGIAEAVAAEWATDRARVYAAGLSAGASMAAIMADAYSDAYAAVGIHSGLACGAAHDMQSAFAAMAKGKPGTHHAKPHRTVPTIIFHGDRDTTVNIANADAVAAQALQGRRLRSRSEDGKASAGHAYNRTVWQDEQERVLVELWRVHGGGHAWFGGSGAGSYTDPQGPDATLEMVRFFLQHRLDL